ncbi:sn-glycerol 3-phosphate transport system substrate-binding protein [Oikeobacillus pervagus]|uniref:Sn-glycerol 3-phosphate transport system substrate-binding protein n=1 Tax=Oikeobacillus pervagus TaxID=1325931 RepID=A0AAJ1SYR3_9BACI|nr:ABC transporter substrate-binding protein [Oikeobacillus pervagus]MDQ0215269.1 sn-glycerol 3-phosphate transport system substrate-binding protein [Oikeobacillus pervagus]
MKKLMRNLLTFTLLMSVLIMTACSSTDEKAGAVKNKDGKTEINFWHAMAGAGEETLNEIVEDFNQSQDQYVVKPEFQGSYEELLTKYRSVGGTKDAPAIVQTFEVGTKYMIDSGFIEPVQSFIDEDNYDLTQLERNILSYYTVDHKLYSMPFNSSTPVLIYNKDAFKEAGLDPEKAPETFNEVKRASAKLTKKKGDSTERYGFSMLTYGWFFEELLATQGGFYVNEDNGRDGDATKALFNGKEGQQVFNFLNDMNKEGTFGNFGTNWDDIRAAFQTEKVAMYLDSSAGVTDIIKNAPFEVGVAYIPHADDTEREGVIIGGASLWMSKGIDQQQQKAAWEFMKFLASPESQAKWHVETGYFAINPEAYDEPIVKEKHQEFPQLKVTVNQLHDTKPSVATKGALITVFPESRQQIVTALENMYQGMDPKKALNQAAKETDKAIEIANKTK